MQFICRTLRGEVPEWSAAGDASVDDVLDAARYHGVAALLCDSARRSPGWETWPERLRQALDAAGRDAVAHELLRSHHLEKVLERFEQAGIRYLLTKGAALAHTHYATPGTRTRSDTDVFIDVGDIETATSAVASADGRILTPVFKAHQFTVACGDETGAVTRIDVHWRILNASRYARSFTFTELFDVSPPIPGARSGRMLAPVHALLLACMHRDGSSRHDPDRLIWLYDIHMLFTGMTDPGRLAFCELALEKGVQRCCLDGLERARQHLGTDVSPQATRLLSVSGPPAGIRERIHDSHLGLLADDWRRLPNWRTRGKLLRELFAPPAETVLGKYGKTDRRWLPVLYARQALDGLVQRLQLK